MSDQPSFDGWGNEDEWAFGSGLKDNFDGTIENIYFGYDSKYNNGNTLVLILEIKDVENGEEARQMYSCGDGWDNAENGSKAVREDGKQTPFNRNSAVVKFLTSLTNAQGIDKVRGQLVEAGFSPYFCTPLKGTTWHWEQKEDSYNVKDRQTGEKKAGSSTRLMPTAFVGGGAEKATGAKKGARKATAKVKNTWDDLDDEVIAEFKELAAECSSQEEFIGKVSEEFSEWPEEAVLDPKFYEFLTS